MKMDDDHDVDRAEQITRLVCGALLGLVAALVVVLKCGLHSHLAIGAVFIGSVLFCSLGALFGGDRFWYGLVVRR